MKKNPAVYVISLGCAKNLVDTEVMCGALITDGFYLSEFEEVSDVCLINTCGFIRDAKEESFEQIEWAIQWKGASKRVIVVAGCLAQREAQMLAEKYPQIDLIVGLNDVPNLPKLIRAITRQSAKNQVQAGLPQYLYTHESPRLTLTPPTYAYVKIAEGCDHRCGYCAIPLIRGNQRSRTPDSVEIECKQLLELGARELDFIAQDSSRYGTDLTPAQNLESLLRRCDALDGNFWLRVLYTHPLHLTPGLLEVLANSKHVLPYLDIPLQHISTSVLAGMRRGMDGQHTKKLLSDIRDKYPNLTLRTTFLVGYPGETDADFQELLSFIKDIRFERLGVFSFSCEEGTPAADIKEGIVPPELAEERKELLLEAQQEISLEHNKQLVGTEMKVLIEEQVSKRKWAGRSMADAPDVDQTVSVTTKRTRDPEDTGFLNVRIKAASEYGLDAEEI